MIAIPHTCRALLRSQVGRLQVDGGCSHMTSRSSKLLFYCYMRNTKQHATGSQIYPSKTECLMPCFKEYDISNSCKICYFSGQKLINFSIYWYEESTPSTKKLQSMTAMLMSSSVCENFHRTCAAVNSCLSELSQKQCLCQAL